MGVSGFVQNLPGAGVRACEATPQVADRMERPRRLLSAAPAQQATPTAPAALPEQPHRTHLPRTREPLQALKSNPATDGLYWRAIDALAAETRAKRADRVHYARSVFEGLRDPESHDGRGEIAADVYQRIEPPVLPTPGDEHEGRLTREEKQLLGAEIAEVPPAAVAGTGEPTWSRSLASFDNVRIDVELPRGASDYLSYKPYRYGTARTIESLKRIASRYRAATGMIMRVGDISKRGVQRLR